MKNAAGEFMFKDFAVFAFTVLSLLLSNAVIERKVSVMNVVKSKVRNRMHLDLLNSIMLLKNHFFVNKICCKEFTPSKEMISRFTSSNMYSLDNKNVAAAEDAADVDEVLLVCNNVM